VSGRPFSYSDNVIDLAAHRAARGAPEPWCRYPQVAEHFGVSERTVLRWKRRGCPHRKVSRRLVLFRITELERWLDGAA
jgi:hypothetical protein